MVCVDLEASWVALVSPSLWEGSWPPCAYELITAPLPAASSLDSPALWGLPAHPPHVAQGYSSLPLLRELFSKIFKWLPSDSFRFQLSRSLSWLHHRQALSCPLISLLSSLFSLLKDVPFSEIALFSDDLSLLLPGICFFPCLVPVIRLMKAGTSPALFTISPPPLPALWAEFSTQQAFRKDLLNEWQWENSLEGTTKSGRWIRLPSYIMGF